MFDSGRWVAIKVLRAAASPDSPAALLRRFEREARVISNLNHPHICTLHDIGEPRTGWTTSSWSTSRARPSLKSSPKAPAAVAHGALDYGVQISEALAAAHASRASCTAI